MPTIKTSELIGPALDWAVATLEGYKNLRVGVYSGELIMDPPRVEYGAVGLYDLDFSTNWAQGGPLIERENITIIRANNVYVDGKWVPNWFAETSQYVGHSASESYEHQQMDPTFMISAEDGMYGPTPLIAAMRCFCYSKLGDEVDIPEELCQQQRS